MEHVKSKGKAILFSSHNLEEVHQVCNTLFFMLIILASMSSQIGATITGIIYGPQPSYSMTDYQQAMNSPNDTYTQSNSQKNYMDYTPSNTRSPGTSICYHRSATSKASWAWGLAE